MSREDTVKSSSQTPAPDAADASDGGDATETARWWKRSPTLGIAAGLSTGIAGIWVLRALGRPSQSGESVFLYMATLPIALLLPALALFGALVARASFTATRGRQRLLMAVPAAAAMLANILAIGMFLRFVLQIFTR